MLNKDDMNELERIAKLETKVCIFEKDMKDIKDNLNILMTNDIPHIQQNIVKIRGDLKLNSWKIAVVTGLVVTILGKLVDYLL